MRIQYANTPAKAVEGLTISKRASKPRSLPYLPHIESITLADDSEAGTLTIDVTDDQTGQAYELEVEISGATEATSLDEMVAAWRASGKLNDLFSVSEDGSLEFLATARHANRSYTFATTPPGSMTATAATEQEAGGSNLRFGRFVARGAGDGEIKALDASSSFGDLEGMLFRTDVNHFHSLENDSPSDVDSLARGKMYSVLEDGRIWVVAEDDVTPASKVYVRRALTSGAGEVGRVRGTPDGSAQVSTFAPLADLPQWSFTLRLRDSDGHVHTFLGEYEATDGTTTVADAIDGLYDSIVDQLGGATSAANGYGVTVTESDTLLTFTTDAGVEIVDLSAALQTGDTEAACGTAVVGTADVDTIDISAIAKFETSASAGELAQLSLKMAA